MLLTVECHLGVDMIGQSVKFRHSNLLIRMYVRCHVVQLHRITNSFNDMQLHIV